MTLPELSVLHSTHDYDNSHIDSQDAMAHLPLDGLETPMYMRTVSLVTKAHVWLTLIELEREYICRASNQIDCPTNANGPFME